MTGWSLYSRIVYDALDVGFWIAIALLGFVLAIYAKEGIRRWTLRSALAARYRKGSRH